MLVLLFITLIAIPVSSHSSTKLVHADAPNLVPNSSFETEEGWGVTFENDATGSFERSDEKAKTGDHSMKLSKENGLGFVHLKSSKPIQVEAGKTYAFRGYFHSEDAPVSSLLLFRAGPEDYDLSYDDIDKTAGFTSQSLLFNAPGDRWEKRVITYKAEKDEEIYLNILLYGNPATVWIDDLEFTTDIGKDPDVHKDYSFPYSEEQVMDILKDRVNASATVDTSGKTARLMINGEATPSAVYKVRSRTPGIRSGDEEQFGKDGMNTVMTQIELGGLEEYTPFWKGPGEYDFSVVDDTLLETLRKNPHANIIVEFYIYPYEGWGEDSLDDVKQNINGEYAYGSRLNIDGYTGNGKTPSNKWFYPSELSDKWKQDAGKAVEAAIDHIQTSDLWKSVIGFQISGHHDLRIHPTDYDYSPVSRAGFQEWLEDKYDDIEQLNHRLDESYESFEQIDVPENPVSGPYEAPDPILGQGLVIEYLEFKEANSYEYRDYFAKLAKEASDKSVITLAYGKNSKYLMDTEYLDGLGDMPYYPYRKPGYANGWKYGTPIQKKNKLLLQELDTRSWVGAQYDEVRQDWMGAGDTPDRWKNINKQLVGASLAQGIGYWYFDMSQYFNDKKIHQKIKKSYNVVEKTYDKADDFKPDVVVVSTGTGYHIGSGSYNDYNAVDNTLRLDQMMLESSGVPYDIHYLDDILGNDELRDYKVYIFPHESYISTEDREKVNQLLKKDGNVIVWQYGTGYVSDNGKSADNISDLVEIDVETKSEYARLTPQMENDAHPITEGVLPFQGMSEMFMNIFTFEGSSPFYSRYQPFWITDDEATTLATYDENGNSAMALKEFDDWTSIYLAAPNSLGNDLLYNIAKEAGAYTIGEPGQSIHMNGNFVSLHGMKNGTYTLQLPEGKDRIIDPETGEIIADGVEEYTFDVKAQTTYWFELDKAFTSKDLKELIDELEETDAFENASIARALRLHLMAVEQYEKQGMTEKVVKHMKGFADLLNHHRENDAISEEAYDTLMFNTDALINRMIESLLVMEAHIEKDNAVAGETVQIRVEVENKSDEVIKDVTATLTGLVESEKVIKQLDPGRSEEVTFEMEIPADMGPGTHSIQADVSFLYKNMEMASAKERQIDILPLLEVDVENDDIRAHKPGDYPISVTLKNNASRAIDATFADDFEDMLTLKMDDPVELDVGETKEVSGNITLSSDIEEGEYKGSIKIRADDTVVQEVPIMVDYSLNLLYNPGFEIGDDAPDGWNTNVAAWEWVTDEVHSGEYALSISPKPSVRNAVYSREKTPVISGGTYRIGGWVKNSSTTGNVNIGIREIDANGDTIRYNWNGTDKDTDWAYYERDFVLSEEATHATVYLIIENVNGQAWFDDVRLEEVVVDDDPNLLYNPGFEIGEDAPDGWSVSGSNWEFDEEEVHSGNVSMSILPKSSGRNAVYSKEHIPVTPGGTYRVGGWAKNSSTTGYVNIGIREIDENGDTIKYNWKTITRDTNWAYYEEDFVLSEEAKYASVYLKLENDVTGQTWFDDMILEEILDE